MLLCYITDRRLLGDDEATRQKNLLARIESAAAAEIDFIQLREKDLSARELESLAGEAMARLARFPKSRLLINSRLDIALAVGAHGVHLRAEDFQASDARYIAAKAGKQIVIGVSCHSAKEVALADSHGADFALLGPIFEKRGETLAPLGLEELRRTCTRPAAAASRMPVLALGGVNLSNARDCMEAGADGVAGIRLFQESAMDQAVKQLRRITHAEKASPRRHPYHPR